MFIIWQSHSHLDSSLVLILQKAIDWIFFSHLEFFTEDEIFVVLNDVYEWLQNYAFSQSFQIVTDLCDNERKQYSCIHHKKKTKNFRKLDEHISKDKSTTCKQKLTRIKTKECKWRCYISYKSQIFRLKKNKMWILELSDDLHTHDMLINSLTYELHKQRQLKLIIWASLFIMHWSEFWKTHLRSLMLYFISTKNNTIIWYHLCSDQSKMSSSIYFNALIISCSRSRFNTFIH